MRGARPRAAPPSWWRSLRRPRWSAPHPEDEDRPWYTRTLWIVVLLVVFFPVGLALAWATSRWQRDTKWVATTAVAVALLVIFVQPQNEVPSSSASPDRVVATATGPPSPTASASTPAASVSPVASPTPPAAPVAAAILARLPVKEREPKDGYTPARFGEPWADTDGNGCDTRNDVLRRDLIEVQLAPGDRCRVLAGTLQDPYTGETIEYRADGPRRVDIDHVVALSDAWQKGGTPWPAGKRLAFANDPLNLLAVSASANLDKDASDASAWLPPDATYRCAMVARQVAVKAKYELWVTAQERDAIAEVLTTCPDQRIPTGGTPTLGPDADTA